LSNTARPKFQTTSPGYFSSSDPENPRKEYRAANARPSGHSGGAPAVSTPHRVSSSVRKGERKAKARKSGRA
jgi:hypothetical protein